MAQVNRTCWYPLAVSVQGQAGREMLCW